MEAAWEEGKGRSRETTEEAPLTIGGRWWPGRSGGWDEEWWVPPALVKIKPFIEHLARQSLIGPMTQILLLSLFYSLFLQLKK